MCVGDTAPAGDWLLLLARTQADFIEDTIAQETRFTYLKWAAIVLLVFTVLLLGAIVGLTWAIVSALKDTESTVGLPTTSTCRCKNPQTQPGSARLPCHGLTCRVTALARFFAGWRTGRPGLQGHAAFRHSRLHDAQRLDAHDGGRTPPARRHRRGCHNLCR